MSRLEDLKTRYERMQASASGEMASYYNGVMLGIELASGAMALDDKDRLQEQVERLQSTLDSVSTGQPNWRRPVPNGERRKNMDQLVEVYSLTDPRTDTVFFVGSASSAVDQVRDYTRTPNAKVSCKPILNELADLGMEPVVEVLETGVALRDAPAAKTRWMQTLVAKGAQLTNQR